MKKAKCIVLVVLLILQVTTVAFAGNNFESNPLITLDIPLSFQPNDIKVMNDNWSEEIAKELSSSGFILKRDATNGLLTINFSKISTKQDNLIVSGNVIINLGEYSKNLNFSNTTLDLIKV